MFQSLNLVHYSTRGFRLVRQEARLLIGLLIVLAGVWVFAEVADEVLEGESRALDERILLAFRHADDLDNPIGPEWIEEAARDVTALGSLAVQAILTAIIFCALVVARQRRAAFIVLLAVVTGVLLSTLLKEGFQRPRPDIVPHATETMTLSFPSGHSLTSAVTFMVLGVLIGRATPLYRLKMFFIVSALFVVTLIGLTRIYLGVHYPTDVVAGWIAGLVWALLWWVVASRLEHLWNAKSVEEPAGGT